ncbi:MULTISPECIES: hypothetical protein [unclassified Leifsonia]|uniref:hypothetical protein n=1 Tax=unclassified Leifsonia TaxID=2663824 RepID=UPI0008A7759F|nr:MULTISPECIES: hypothetical protein [unclassified Leifsonia]SEH99106.1 hypothetical protein SAMN04515694_1093 [Leifsonia sp. CL154]SFL68782.1 hypothetical protein SAMN04515692_109132 [Leifsonia sp. CL147]
MTRRLGVVIGVTAALLVVLISCSAIGYTVKQTNLANQRTAALALLETQSGVEQIRFTQEGSVGGSGTWAVNAVIAIEGREYQEILGVRKWSVGGEPMPTVEPSATPAAVTVIYSDGTSEVLK